MNKRINGLLYSTDSATRIGCYEHGSRVDDSDWYDETLYQKKTGEFFIHGVGGPRSPYCQSTDRSGWLASGEKIILIPVDAAKEWAVEHLDPSVIDRYFGEFIEDAVRRIVSFSLSDAAISRLSDAAAARNQSKSSLIEDLIFTL